MSQEPCPTGLTTLQLEQLCQAEQIEETMRLLFALNHWAKARERLFFADRQGLYLIKAAILQQAYACCLLTAKAYIDGKEGFGEELSCDLAADIAAEGFLWRLEELATDSAGEQEDACERIVHQLYTRITGKTRISTSDVEALEVSQVHRYILKRLQELERGARASGQPIPHKSLTELCIAPSDLLTIHDRRYYDLGDWDSWDQLDTSDLRKLDPEGLSLIALDYTSPTAHYIFHLPFRMAQAFVPAKQIAWLKSAPWSSRESGEYYGRTVTEMESLQQPIADILHELGATITDICPRQLSDKKDFTFAQAMRYAAWSNEVFDEDDDDDDDDDEEAEQFATYWQNLVRIASNHCEPGACPFCHMPAKAVAPCLARVEHWQQEHPDQDLTISQASWILDSDLEKKTFCLQYPPDYRTPHERGFGTRYWKMETLLGWVHQKEKGALTR
jgi:hypothetical protein